MMKVTLFAVVLIVTGTAFAEQYEHPDLKSGKKPVNSILVMPVQVELVKRGMKGAEPMMEESREAEKELTPVIADVLRKYGCKVDAGTFAPEALDKNAQLRYTVDDLQKRFDAELQQLRRKPKDVRKARYTLGDIVAKLPAGSGFDALLFVRTTGRVFTRGKKAFSWAVQFPAVDDVQIYMAVVDANTGEILYYANTYVGNVAKNAAGTRSDIEHEFKQFAKHNAGPKLKSVEAPQ